MIYYSWGILLKNYHVDIGQNAQILGGIYIADGVKIGAGAVVTKSVLVPGVTVVGVPARIVEK